MTLSFASAFADWQALARRHGPALAYRPALKLPDLARAEGEIARAQADWAVGSMLFWMGRLSDAREWLPPSPELGWTQALLGEYTSAAIQPKNATLDFFLDDPHACLRGLGTASGPVAIALEELLRYWAHSRLAEPPNEAATQRALATLRRDSPCDEAHGMAIYAMAAFQQHPVHALTHLDHALDLFARFGLHYLEPRLLELKSRALDAAGLPGDANRFLRAATEARRRQGR